MPKKDRYRPGYDIERKLAKIIDTISAEYGVPKSQVVNWLLAEGLIGVRRGRLDPRPRLRLSDSKFNPHNLDISDLLDDLPDE